MKKILITGVRGNISTRLRSLLESKNEFEVANISIRDNSWQDFVFSGYDALVHVVGVVPQTAKSEEEYQRINTDLTWRLAQKAKSENINQFIYISSMAVYGIGPQRDQESGTITERTACNPSSIYGISKLSAEKKLEELEDDRFGVTIIRVPSIISEERKEYLEQYKYLAEKFPILPIAFQKNVKSFTYIDNLCELIYLLIDKRYLGIVCPDDGGFTAYDLCRMLAPKKHRSRLLGLVMEKLFQNNPRIIDYYGTIAYSEELSNLFDGKYRIVGIEETIKRIYG